MTRSRFRPLVLAVLCLAALGLPGPESGRLISIYLVPFLVGALFAFMLSDRRLAFQIALLLSVVALIGVVRLIWEAIALDGGDFRFDGEIGLVITGIVVELIFSLIGFSVVWLILAKRRTMA